MPSYETDKQVIFKLWKWNIRKEEYRWEIMRTA